MRSAKWALLGAALALALAPAHALAHGGNPNYRSEIDSFPLVKDTSEKTRIFDYEVPMSVDGKPTVLHGTLWWVGAAGTSKLPFVIAAIVIVLGGGALVLWIRRRRDRDDPAPTGEAW
jgi:hypothetical protein